jgi:hypothetical protein
VLVGSAVVCPLAVPAQQPDRTQLVGVLTGYAESDPAVQSQMAVFRSALAKLGVDGRQQSPNRTSLGRR